MALIKGELTINETKFVELDDNPLISPTYGLEIGDFCIVNNIPGVWHKVGPGDYDIVRVDMLSSQSTHTTSNGTLSLVNSSNNVQVFTGTVAGQIVDLPDATLLPLSTRYEFWNTSTQSIVIRDFGTNPIVTVGPSEVGFIILNDTSISNGVWRSISIAPPLGLSYGTPVSIGTANADGIASTVSRSDHVHDHGPQSTGNHHAVATSILNGFMSSTDKLKIDGLVTKSGEAPFGSFSGTPLKYQVTFSTPFASTAYSVNITGQDPRGWSIEYKYTTGFIINSNARSLLTGDVQWQAQLDNEVG
jgi:hypothetical protein